MVQATSIARTTATITWTTDELADSQVEFGRTTSYGSATTLNTSRVITHSVKLTGLRANTSYNYRVKSKDAAGNRAISPNLVFTTLK